MKLTIAAILLVLSTVPALAQTYNVSRSGKGMMVQGSDGSVYHYSIAPDGGYIVQKEGQSGSYQASPPSGGGYVIQGVDTPDWKLPVVVPPQQ